ncbi:MAG: hypothetical protein WCL50_10115, partial [Spirochaetota bacterium]
LVSLGKRGRTIFVAGSSSDLAYRFATEIGVMRRGALVAWGSYEEAEAWDDPALRSVVGRLRPRPRAEGLLDAWAEAITGEPPQGQVDGTHSPISEDR